ncbi:MAG: acyltransferase family protein [Gaiellaceae bacterium]
MSRIRSVEGARGIAALMVFSFHLRTQSRGQLGPLDWVLGRCWLGVTFFFVLSGFLLYRPFITGTVPLRRYFAHRFARIVPAYWFALIVVIAAFPAGLPHTLWPNFLFLQHDYGSHPDWIILPAWTLCIEVTFYLALPVLAIVLRGSPWRIGLLIPAGFVYMAIAKHEHVPLRTLGDAIGLFACGMLAAVAYERGWVRMPLRVGAALGVVGLASFDRFGGWQVNALAELLMAGFFASVVLAIARGRLAVFSWRPLVGLGTISYGFYLWHLPLIWHVPLFIGRVGFFLDFVLVLLVTASVATFSWYAVERPAIWFVRWFPNRRRERHALTALPAAAD